jgi:hypothetical protein
MKNLRNWTFGLLVICSACLGHVHGQSFDPVKVAQLHGGLIVQLGASDISIAQHSEEHRTLEGRKPSGEDDLPDSLQGTSEGSV